MIKIYISRFNPETDKKPYLKSYEIEKTPQMNVLDALQAINNKYNDNISFRSSCRAGQCGSCSIKFNGEGALACQKEIENEAIIEPLDLPIIKDLVVDRTSLDEKVKKLNLEINNEKSETFEKIANSKLQDTKKLRSCIECYSCLNSCPVIKYFKDEFDGPYFMRYFGKYVFDPKDNENRIPDTIKEGLYKCTSCGKCKIVCPKNINTFGDAIEKMRAIATCENLGPKDEHKIFKENILKTGRSIVKKDSSFLEDNHKENNAKIALFTGCLVDYRLQHVGEALINVFKANNIDIDIPENQVCCGSPLLRTGQVDPVKKLVKQNYEVFKDYDTVITICAGCGATLKNDHPKFGSKLHIQDISEFLIDKLDLSDKSLDMTVTWHDPCHLANGQGIKDEPREILKEICNFSEMKHPNQCCGAGGGIKAAYPEMALKLSKEKAKMIKETDADAVITICPFCQNNLKDGLDALNMNDTKVMNILELLDLVYNEE